MTKRRRKANRDYKKNSSTDFFTDTNRLNRLRKVFQEVNPITQDLSKTHIEKCFFCLATINDENIQECHLVPESFLEKIAEDYKVSTIDSISSLQSRDPENFFNSTIYIASALTFFGVCKECDGPRFSKYEGGFSEILSQAQMKEIALKTLLAFHHDSINRHYRATIFLKESEQATQKYKNNYNAKKDLILRHEENLHNYKLLHKSTSNSASFSLAMAEKIRDTNVQFSKIIDFEVEGKPVVAIQSFYRYENNAIFINVFPTLTGSRIIIFKEAVDHPLDTEVLNFSVIKILAISMVSFRRGLAVSPSISKSFNNEDSMFKLLGPESLHFKTPDSLKNIDTKKLKSEINLDDKRLFRLLHTFR